MASAPNLPAAAPVATIGIPVLPNVTRILARFQRPQIEAFITIAIDLLDTIDGDSEVEANGDETDHMGSEDDYNPASHRFDGPGCPLSDPGEDNDSDFCTAGDDRGTNWRGHAPGFARSAGFDDDDEMSRQPLSLNPG